MLIFLLLREMNKTVLLIKGNGREIGINRDITKSGTAYLRFKQIFYQINQPCTNALAAIIFGHSKTAYLYTRITAELFANRETRLNLFPTASRNLIAADTIVQKTEISNDTSIVFHDERIGNTQLSGLFGIADQESIQVLVSTVEVSQLIIKRKRNKFHRLPANSNMLSCLCDCFLKLLTSRGFLLWSPVFYHQPSPFEVEGILAFQYRRLSNRSCHNNLSFNIRCKDNTNLEKLQRIRRKSIESNK